ncbi:hypothetical protein BC830DRAFT_71660, partial [Chytriomyces sp. MP71]
MSATGFPATPYYSSSSCYLTVVGASTLPTARAANPPRLHPSHFLVSYRTLGVGESPGDWIWSNNTQASFFTQYHDASCTHAWCNYSRKFCFFCNTLFEAARTLFNAPPMAAPPPGLYTAQAFWEDASCGLTSAPLVPAARIDYSFANGGDCSASTLPPGCAAAASNGGWYHEDACVAAAAASTYANSFWVSVPGACLRASPEPSIVEQGNFSRVQRAVYPDAQCNQMPSAIHEYPYGFCTKTVGAQSATINGVNYPYFSERFSINATDGTLFWSIYSDNSCNHFSASVNYGQQITSDCIHNTKTTFLYYHGLAAYTTYSSSDCTQPTGIQIQASPVDCETSKSSACFQDVTTDYITSQCGQTLDALSLAKAKFGSQPFALVNYYVDQACSIPLEPAVLLLNKCITRN